MYWYGTGSEILDESDSSGNITDEYVYFGGKRVAHRVVSGNSIYYYGEDFLGISRQIFTSASALCYDADFYPFGGERPYTDTCPPTYKFEGKERDTETNNDDFGARYYSSSFGRWTSPDWSAIPTPVPYSNLTNPQTLNLYVMVSDNPESFADLDGHCCDKDSIEDFGLGVLNALANDFAGTQRIQGNADTSSGQRLGDALAVVGGTAGAITAAVTDVTVDVGSGGAGLLAAPVQLAAVAIPANGAYQGAQNLFKSSVENTSSGKPYEDTPENRERMQEGKAPIGKDGKPVELHHEGQQANGQTREMTQTEHRGGENFRNNHPNTGQQPSQINRNQANNARRQHWKHKAKEPK